MCGAGVAVVLLLFFEDWIPSSAPATAECVALWNAPANGAHRSEVSVLDYPSAEIGGAFSEDRYQGCFVTFSSGVGRPWAMYSATRLPGTDRELRWQLDVAEREWGSGFQAPPFDRPRSNASVRPDGSLVLR